MRTEVRGQISKLSCDFDLLIGHCSCRETITTPTTGLKAGNDYTMRILCLHGMGSNARVFESQLNGIISDLKQFGHEFVFVDGIMPCEPDPSILQRPLTSDMSPELIVSRVQTNLPTAIPLILHRASSRGPRRRKRIHTRDDRGSRPIRWCDGIFSRLRARCFHDAGRR